MVPGEQHRHVGQTHRMATCPPAHLSGGAPVTDVGTAHTALTASTEGKLGHWGHGVPGDLTLPGPIELSSLQRKCSCFRNQSFLEHLQPQLNAPLSSPPQVSLEDPEDLMTDVKAQMGEPSNRSAQLGCQGKGGSQLNHLSPPPRRTSQGLCFATCWQQRMPSGTWDP